MGRSELRQHIFRMLFLIEFNGKDEMPEQIELDVYKRQHCGCIMLATAHGASLEELRRKPLFDELIARQRFERYIVLSNETRTGGIIGVYDANGARLC